MKKAVEVDGRKEPIVTISQIMDAGRHLWTQQNVANAIHWGTIISAIIVSVGTTVLVPGTEKVAGYGIAISLVSLAQIVHKITDALDRKQTLLQAVEATLPVIAASAAGNEHQLNEVEKEIHK